MLDLPSTHAAPTADPTLPEAPMRIVHVVRQFHPAVGGIEAMVGNLAREQAKAGHVVRVVTLNRLFHGDGSRLPARESLGRVEIRRIGYAGSSRYPLAPAVLRHLSGADVVHVHAVDFFFDFLALTQWIHRKVLVVSTHGGFFHTSFARPLKVIYFNTVTRVLLSRYAYVIASSLQDEVTFARLRSSAIGVIENGVDIDKFHGRSARNGEKTILYFGRIAPHKNVGLLFPFLRALREQDGAWRLIVAGRPNGVTFEQLQASARASGVLDDVELVSDPSDNLLREAIAKSSVFASASAYEGFGIAAVEAASSGLLPVLSDIPPHGRTVERLGFGMLVNFRQPEQAAARFVERWRDWDADRQERRAHALGAVRPFAWPGVSRQFEQVYCRVVGRRSRCILGLEAQVTDVEELTEHLDDAIACSTPVWLAFLNANLANLACADDGYRKTLRRFLLVNDGVGVDIASWLLYGRRFPQNLNGTDFTPYFLDHTRHRLRVFLLGGRREVLRAAADEFGARWPSHTVVGVQDGYFPPGEGEAVAGCVRASGADLVLVGMGNPRQEQWIAEHLDGCGCSALAVGAFFDFLSGRVRRAPGWIRAIRCEWIFRLLLEPRRLWQRYLIGNAAFLARVLAQAARGERAL